MNNEMTIDWYTHYSKKTPTFIVVLKSFKYTDSSFKSGTYDRKFSKQYLNVPKISKLPNSNSTMSTKYKQPNSEIHIPYQS